MANEANTTVTSGAGAREPDDLLIEVRRSILGLALALSALIHVVLIGGTSFSLYRDWAKYGLSSDERGFHTPSDINLIKAQEQRAADDAARKAASERKATEAAAFAATNAPAATATVAAPGGTTTNAGAIKPPEVQPLPPKSEFTFGDDLVL